MRITQIDCHLVSLPARRAIALPVAGKASPGAKNVTVVVTRVHSDTGLTGLGFGSYVGSGRAVQAAIQDDISPRLLGEDPCYHERLWAKINGPLGPACGYAVVDLALWDLKAKAAAVPLASLLGGMRASAKAFTAETAPARLSAEEIIAIARPALASGLMGVRVGVAGIDPEADSQKIVTVRDTLGEEIWFAVSVKGSFDYETALPFGRFIEEEIGADWYENPVPGDDSGSYHRLGNRIDTPLAVGATFTRVSDFAGFLRAGARAILRPDLIRLGGLTPWLKVAALAEAHHCPIVPHLLPEIGVHLACGLRGVQAVEYVTWLAPLFKTPLLPVDGQLSPPQQPGIGLELNPDVLERFGRSRST
jgi:L-alanine-DL-glutamate epimerase-like enolase superfamily enzyme